MSWRYVDIERVYWIHEQVIKRAKTKAGVRDFALLHSAVERAKATYGGKDLYPTVFAKAAAYLQSICFNHPFTDGNKRTSYAVAHKFLWDNGYHLKVSKNEAVKFMRRVDNQKPDFNEISSWLKKYSKKLD